VNDIPSIHTVSRRQVKLRDLLLLVLLVSVALGWWVDRTQLQRRATTLQQELASTAEAALYGKRRLVEELKRPEVVGESLALFPEVQRFATEWREQSEPPILPWGMAEKKAGAKYVGYYIETNPAERHEGHPGVWVWSVDGKFLAVAPVVISE
jgi:hypothetical protein